ncbi:MAG: hypothetical protein ABI780_11990 [Ardenticatenales bacterium]
MDADQFYAASLEAMREIRDELRALREAVAVKLVAASNGHAAQLELAVEVDADRFVRGVDMARRPSVTNVHTVRCDPYGQELPRGISWDPSGAVWAVGATNRERGRRRVRVQASRFPGEPAAGLAEARRVLAFLADPNARDARALLAAMHQDTARAVAEAMAR